MSTTIIGFGEPGECFNPFCGYSDDHDHGDECTTDCPCGLGEVTE